jgi:hypothetical protein
MEIWKFNLQPGVMNKIEMPRNARLLSVGCQYGELVIWAVVVPSNTPRLRNVLVVGTGQSSQETVGTFVGTIQDHRDLVWHVFDRGQEQL